MNITHSLRELKKIYTQNKLIPFLGAGLSKPHKLPDWPILLQSLNEELIDDIKIGDLITLDINQKEYWNAIESIKTYSFKDDFYIQSKTAEIMLKLKEKIVADDNYRDLAKLREPFFLTTNYDNNISSYVQTEYPSIILSDAGVSTQSWSSSDILRQVVHLHGTFSNPYTIVLTKKKYDEVYENEKYTNLFTFLRSGFSFLFVGFSYSDKYIEFLMNKNKGIFNDYHYILLANPTDEIKKNFMEKYRIHVIPYEVKNISDSNEHILAIREVISFLESDSDKINF